MKLEFIATLASPEVRLRFLAMERSLRAVGCDLPLRVIPYHEGRFDLPRNAEWWEDAKLCDWLMQWKAHPTMRKYQCLLEKNFQFVDSDVIFLRNPNEVLAACEGFITSCGHWKYPNETLTAESESLVSQKSTNWQLSIFNTGQWACDRRLYSFEQLRERCEAEGFRNTCLTFPHHEQPGINLLVNTSDVVINNVTLPPLRMESTWAGDYIDAHFERFWVDNQRKPYLIHWAGCDMSKARPIDRLMEDFLLSDELDAWRQEIRSRSEKTKAIERSLRGRLRRWKRAVMAGARELSRS
ncbi:hypothetical protein [Prosthecobacter vanneervenii]|uniref:Nucleotide-diphospho-sugar transferase domain-containing protein n=1 Tax=Prosthecobacter vanneervenii TaxID=48466 RepID=A0A7W7Y7C8_9BACT|nr:hypothetical protein [Prosthecobacter vanneervenii]MBB5030967.1 hypothetical protein [Prosthecobacter vanneervenii]